MEQDRTTTLLGFAGAVAVLAALVWVVGLDAVIAALSRAQADVLVLVVVVAGVWLSAWGLSLRTVLSAIGTPLSVTSSILVFAAAVFSNNVTPFGQAGGEPVSGLLISQATDSDYETGLAAIASVDTLHFVPSVGFALVGFTFVAASAVRLGRNLVFAAAAVAVLAVGFPVAAYLGWRYRYEMEALVVRALTPFLRAAGRLLPGRAPPSPHAIEARIEGFFVAIDRVAGDRRTLVTAVGFSALGWLCLALSLWLSLYSLGYTVPFAAVLLVVPVGSIAGVMPLPGGSGAIETVLVTLLVPTTGVPAAVATSAVLIHRGATYWLPTLVGGGVATALGADRAQQTD
ncbi:MAG: YbhN family protein [Haloarculaceae archaeon]